MRESRIKPFEPPDSMQIIRVKWTVGYLTRGCRLADVKESICVEAQPMHTLSAIK